MQAERQNSDAAANELISIVNRLLDAFQRVVQVRISVCQ